MTPATARGLVRRVGPDPDPPADADLTARVARSADPAAFAALVRRHGPMVLAACRRMLPEPADADDAFQAVFVVLLRKAGAVRPPGAVGGWLHGVAVRTALKARVAAARRRRHEMTGVRVAPETPGAYAPGSAEHEELRAVLDEELANLPEPLRAAVVLCDLGGKTRAEAAADLRCPEGTVAARLHRARKALAERLARRGVTAPAALACAAVAVPAELFAAVAGFAAGTPVPPAVRALADGVVRGLAAHPLSLAFTAVAVAALAAGAGVLWAAAPQPPGAGPAPAPPAEVKVGAIHYVGYSADGSKLVHVGGGKAVVRDAATQAERYAVDAEFAQFGGDGKALFVLEKDQFRTLDAATGKVLATAPRSGPEGRMPGQNAAFSADGTRRAEHDGWSVSLAGGPVLDGQGPVNLGAMNVLNHGHNVAFSPDGTKLAGVHQRTADFTRSVPVAVWDAATGRRLGLIAGEPNNAAHAFAWSPSGAELAVGVNGGVAVHDAETLKEVRRVAVPKGTSLTALAWSADGRTLAAGLLVWETTGDTGLSADLVAQRVSVALFDAADGKQLRRIDGFADNLPVVALAFRPDGKELACAAGFLPADGPAGNLPQPAKDAVGLRVVALDPPAAPRGAGHVTDLSFAPDGKTYLVVAGGKAAVKDFATDKVLWEAPAEAAQFSADGTAVATMGATEVTRRSAATGEAQTAWPRPMTAAPWTRVAFNRDWHEFAAHSDYEARLFRHAGDPPPVLEERHAPLSDRVILRPTGKDVVFSPDGRLVAAVGVMLTPTENGAAVWDARTGKRVHVYPPLGDSGEWRPATAVAFSADGKQLAVAVAETVQLFDTTRFAAGPRLPDTPGSGLVTALAFAPDGKALAVGYRLPLLHGGEKQPRVVGHKTEVQLVEIATGKELKRFDGFEGVNHMGPTVLPLTALAFTPDGATLLAGTGRSPVDDTPANTPARGEVRRFAVAAPPAPPAGTGHVSDLSVAPDGKTYLVVAGGKAAVKDFATDKVLWEAPAEAARFGADGQTVHLLGGPPPPPLPPVLTVDELPKLLEGRTVERRNAATGKLLAAVPRGKTDLFPHVSAASPAGAHAAHVGHAARLFDAAGRPVPLAPDRGLLGSAVVPPVGKDVFFSADGARVVAVGVHTGGGRLGAAVWDAATGKELLAAPPPDARASATAAALGADGTLAVVAFGARLRAYDLARPVAPARRFPDLHGPATALAVSPDAKFVAVGFRRPAGGGFQSEVLLLDANAGNVQKRFDGFGTALPVTALAFTPDGTTLLAGTGRSSVEPLAADAPARGEVKRLAVAAPTARAAVSDLWFAPDGKTYLAVAGGKARVKDAATDELIWEAKAEAARFTPDGAAVMTLGEKVVRRDAGTGKALAEHPRDEVEEPARAAAFDPAGKRYAVHFGGHVRSFAVPAGIDFPLGPGPIVPQRAMPPAVAERLAWSPDGKRLVAVGALAVGGGLRRGVEQWLIPGGTERPVPDAGGFRGAEAVAAAYSPDGKTLAVATKHDVYFWADGAKTPRREALLGDLGAVGFLPDGRLVVAGEGRYADGGKAPEETVYHRRLFVHVVDPKADFGGHAAIDFAAPPRPDGAPPVTALAASPDGKTFLVGTAGGAVARLTLAARPPAAKAPAWRESVSLPFDDRVHSLAFTPDGKGLAVGGRGGAARHTATMLDAATLKKLWAGGPLPAGTTGIAVSPDGKLVAATRDAATGLYDAATGRPVPINPPLPGGTAVAFSPAGTHLAVGDGARTVVVPVGGGAAVLDRPTHAERGKVGPATLAWAPDGARLAVPYHDPIDGRFGCDLYALPTGKATPLTGHPARVSAAAWSADGTRIATGCQKGDVVTWDAATLKELTRTRIGGRGGESHVRALAFSPDSATLAAAVSFDEGKNAERVVLLDPATGARRQDLQGFGNFTPVAVAFAPDGRTLAVGLADFLPQIEPPPGGKDRPLGSVALFTTAPEPRADAPPPAWRPRPATNGRAAVAALAFAADGKRFALAGADGVIEFVPADTLKAAPSPHRLKGPVGPGALAFVPHTGHLAAADADGVTLHDPSGIKLSHRPWAVPTRVLAFAPDGTRAALRDGGPVLVLPFPPPVRPLPGGPQARPNTDEVPPVAWSPDGKRLVAATRLPGSGYWALTEPTADASVHALGHAPDQFGGMAWTRDGKHVVTGGHDGTVIVTDAATWKEVRRWSTAGPGERVRVLAVAVAADGVVLTAIEARAEQQARPVAPVHAVVGRELATGREVVRLTLPAGGPVVALALSPDGRLLVAGRGPADGPNPGPALVVWEYR